MFKRFTAPIIEALNSIGVKAYLEGRNDLLIDGAKFSGNAVCVHKNRILQHGTLLFSASMANLSAALKTRPEKFIGKAVQSNRSRVTNISEHLNKANANGNMDIIGFKNFLQDYICAKYKNITPYSYSEKDLMEIDKLVEEKYSKDSWNFGISPAYSFSKVTKLHSGIVEVYFNVNKGVITQLEIFGDYFFTKPTSEFISQLIGTEHLPASIKNAICNIDKKLKEEGNPTGIGSYFSGVSVDEIANMFWQSESETSSTKL
jgi:Lipoate-protein ligase A